MPSKVLRSFAASCSRTASSNLERVVSACVFAGATTSAERLGFFNGRLLLGTLWLNEFNQGTLDGVAEESDHLDDVGEWDVYRPCFDEASFVSKVQVFGPVEDGRDASRFGGV